MATRPSTPSEERQGPANADLSTLRSILLAQDRERLDALEAYLRDRQRRADDVADVLPEALLREFARAPRRLKAAVREPFQETLHEAIRDDPRPVADALFPVIGPAIRRYITASLRAFAESLSRTIELGLSPRRQLVWRYKAWRRGIGFGQYVLQRTFVYCVEHVYLIHTRTGLLIGEAHRAASPPMDSDAVSGMLAALQSFAHDSFALEDGHGLRTADFGDFTLWAMHGPHAMLACAIRGNPGADLRNRLETALDNLHLRHGKHLQAFDGNRDTLPAALPATLEACLLERHADECGSRRRPGVKSWLVLLLVLALAGYFAWHEFEDLLTTQRLRDALDRTPGILLTSIDARDGAFHVRGLRDPLAPDLDAIAAGAGLTDVRMLDLTEPYQSLESELVLARLERVLAPPDKVTLRLEGGVLYLSGEAEPAWMARVAELTVISPAIARIDTSGLAVSDEALLRAARARLAPPAGVTLEVAEGVLSARGEASARWLALAQERAPGLVGLRRFDSDAVAVVERRRAQALIRALAERHLQFVLGATRYEDADAARLRLQRHAAELTELARLAQSLGATLRVDVVGHTDGAGDEALNAQLRAGRAQRVRDDLVALGVPATFLRVRSASAVAVENPGLRMVALRAQLIEPGGSAAVTPGADRVPLSGGTAP